MSRYIDVNKAIQILSIMKQKEDRQTYFGQHRAGAFRAAMEVLHKLPAIPIILCKDCGYSSPEAIGRDSLVFCEKYEQVKRCDGFCDLGWRE